MDSKHKRHFKKKNSRKKSITNKKSLQKIKELEKQLKKMKHIVSITTNIIFILFVLVCFFFLLNMKTHVVQGNSMNPTLHNYDYIMVNKRKQPKRYDIITFVPKGKPKGSYVKRIIGMPGDTIWTDKGFLFINHQLTNEANILYGNSTNSIDLPDGTVKINLSKEAYSEIESLDVIPDGRYFVLGDNRNHSNDSRAFGLISSEQIEGTMTFRYFPFNKMGLVK